MPVNHKEKEFDALKEKEFDDLILIRKIAGRSFAMFGDSKYPFFAKYQSVKEFGYSILSIAGGPIAGVIGALLAVANILSDIAGLGIGVVQNDDLQISQSWEHLKKSSFDLPCSIVIGVLSPLLNTIAILGGLFNTVKECGSSIPRYAQRL